MEHVLAATAVEKVVVEPTVKEVVGVAADQDVVAVEAEYRVGAALAVDLVAFRAAGEAVVAIGPLDVHGLAEQELVDWSVIAVLECFLGLAQL